MTSASPRSILVLSGRYHIISNASLVNNCIISHGLPDVTLQSTRHEVILTGLREVTSERQVISHDPSVTSTFLWSKNGRKCITYIYYIIKQLLTYVSVDMECY